MCCPKHPLLCHTAGFCFPHLALELALCVEHVHRHERLGVQLKWCAQKKNRGVTAKHRTAQYTLWQTIREYYHGNR